MHRIADTRILDWVNDTKIRVGVIVIFLRLHYRFASTWASDIAFRSFPWYPCSSLVPGLGVAARLYQWTYVRKMLTKCFISLPMWDGDQVRLTPSTCSVFQIWFNFSDIVPLYPLSFLSADKWRWHAFCTGFTHLSSFKTCNIDVVILHKRATTTGKELDKQLAQASTHKPGFLLYNMLKKPLPRFTVWWSLGWCASLETIRAL